MSNQNSIPDLGVSRSLLAVDGETNTETRRLHTLTAGTVNGLAVAIIDGAGAQITSFGGGTQYTEDDPAAANPVGTALIGIRADALAGLTTADGDNVAGRMTDKGELYVKHSDKISIYSIDAGDTNIGNVDVVTMPVVTIIHGITGIAHGVKTITTAGTDEALAGSTACKKVIIQSQTDNTGLIAVGTSGVDATEATGTGVILYAGDALEIEIDNLADVYIDATVSGEGVRYSWFS